MRTVRKPVKIPSLLPWHIIYIKEYISTGDKVEALRRARPKYRNVPDKTCITAVDNLLRGRYSLLVQAELEKLRLQRLSLASGVQEAQSREQILKALASIAFDDDARRGDRLKALELLGKDLGMFKAEAVTQDETPASLTINIGKKGSAGGQSKDS